MTVVDLPLPRNLPNDRLHWRTKQNAKKKYWKLCSLLKDMGQLPKPPRMPPAKAVISCHIIVGGKMDEDNLMARLKWAIDWLVGNDYLRGDSMDHLIWKERPTQSVKRSVSYRAIFTIEDAAVDE